MKAVVKILAVLEVTVENTWEARASIGQIRGDAVRDGRARLEKLLRDGPVDVGQWARGVRLVSAEEASVTLSGEAT